MKYYFIEENELKHIFEGYIKYKALARGGVSHWENYTKALDSYLHAWVVNENMNPEIKWNFEDVAKDYCSCYQSLMV